MNIDPFGEINSDSVRACYCGNVRVREAIIDIDLNFESTSVHNALLEAIHHVIENIAEFSDRVWKAISDDWNLDEDSKTVRLYLQHHLEALSEEEIVDLFGTAIVDKQLYFDALFLTGISLSPENEDMFVTFDIQFPNDVTNYLMSVSLTQRGQVTDIRFES